MEQTIIRFINTIFNQVTGSLIHNWFPLSSAILIAVLLKNVIDPGKLRKVLTRGSKISVLASVAAGAFTPLCACGTSAVIIAMATTALPWAPIMAFLTSSPLMSPEGFIMLAGIININFAVALTVASIIIGLGSGYITHIIEKKTHLLDNQIRFTNKNNSCSSGCTTLPTEIKKNHVSCECTTPLLTQPALCCGPDTCCIIPATPAFQNTVINNRKHSHAAIENQHMTWNILNKIKWKEILQSFVDIGLKKILLFFSIFVAVGYMINLLVPTRLITTLFNSGNIFSVPLAGLIGFPIYVTGESAVPLIKSLMSGGASRGAMLTFMITGPGTSAWVIAGISTFMKKRAVFLYIILLLFWGILLGYVYDLIHFFGV